MLKKILVFGVALIMCMGILSGCISGIKFNIAYNEAGSFGRKETDNGLSFSVTALIKSLDEMKNLCEEWNNPAFRENSESYSIELSQKIREHNEIFFEEKVLIVYSSQRGQPGRTIQVDNIEREGSELTITTYLSPKKGTFDDVSITWLLLIEIGKSDIVDIANIQIIRK